jgi:hypothetical protein
MILILRVGIFGPSTFTFPIVLESKPPPFEDHKGWGTRTRTRKSQTSPSALRYRSGTIQPRELMNRKTRKGGPAWATRPYDTPEGADTMTNEENILAVLARIERKLDDIERKVRAVAQDTAQVRKVVKA